MARIATSESFNGFGPSFLGRSVLSDCAESQLVGDLVTSRRNLRGTLPAEPGVYGWIGSEGQLHYVGKSKSLRHRLVSYFATNTTDPKMERIRHASRRIFWQTTGHELLALLREQELINRFRPQFNSQGQPQRRRPAFVVISDTAAPHAAVVRKLSARSLVAWGPILGTSQLNESIAALNHVFRLRDCPDKTGFVFGDQLSLFDGVDDRAQCLRHELGTCPAPCASCCTRDAYQKNVESAIRFLNGESAGVLNRLERMMQSACEKLQFERAAIHCSQWQALKRLNGQLSRLRSNRERIHGVLPVRAGTGGRLWIVFREGEFSDAVRLPGRLEMRRKIIDRLQTTRQQSGPGRDDILSIELRLIVATWFRRHPEMLSQIVPFANAHELIDLRPRKSA